MTSLATAGLPVDAERLLRVALGNRRSRPRVDLPLGGIG